MLYLDLKRMELDYLEQNKRDYEITKHFSLKLLNPTAFIQLKEKGRCYLRLDEMAFDLESGL
jgi:hypothetical protein